MGWIKLMLKVVGLKEFLQLMTTSVQPKINGTQSIFKFLKNLYGLYLVPNSVDTNNK